jgi:hypothetical protein
MRPREFLRPDQKWISLVSFSLLLLCNRNYKHCHRLSQLPVSQTKRYEASTCTRPPEFLCPDQDCSIRLRLQFLYERESKSRA